MAGEPFYTLITGTLTHPIRVVNAATPALTELAFAALAGQQRSPEAFAMDRHLPELLHIDVVPWPAIEVPTEPPPAPEPTEAPEPAPERRSGLRSPLSLGEFQNPEPLRHVELGQPCRRPGS